MVRVITQETYDEVVKENIEEFDMSPEEAIKDAMQQFEAQGVDLSNIIKDLILSGGDGNPVSTPINKIQELSIKDSIDEAQITKQLEVLKTECNKDIARKMKAGKENAYTILLNLLEKRTRDYKAFGREQDALIVNVLNTLTALMDGQPDLLDNNGLDLIKSLLSINNEAIQLSTLKWTTVSCIKHEINRQKIFSRNIADDLLMFLTKSKNNKILSEAMQVTRKMTLDDDIRVEFGKAHDHAKELGVKLLGPLTDLLQANSKSPLTSELLLTIACLLVRHELCKMAAGCAPALLEAMADNCGDVLQVQQGSKLITALAGNDDVKRDLMKSGVAPILVLLLRKHAANAQASSVMLKSLAALTLREPEHAKQFVDCEAPEVIVECLELHPDNPSVQKNGCWAVRNMVARCKEHNSKFKELGIEPLLNLAIQKYDKEFGYDIKSALRDLECDVKFEEQWTGKGVQMEQ